MNASRISVLAAAVLLVGAGTARSKSALPNDVIGHALASVGYGSLQPRLVAPLPPIRIAPSPVPNTTRLQQVEQALATKGALSSGPARSVSLMDYFREANPAAFAHLSSLASEDARPGVTFLRVPADETRAFLYARIGPEGTARLDVLPRSELPAMGSGDVLSSVETPRGRVVLSRGRRLPDVVRRLDALDPRAPLWVVSGLQGLHPETAAALLCELERRLSAGVAPHVVVLRGALPERPATDGCARPARRADFTIDEPSFRTTGDLRFRIEELNRSLGDGRAVEPAKVLAVLDRFPWLRASFATVPVSQATMRFAANQPPGGFTEQSLRAAFLGRFLQWNADLDGRPADSLPNYNEYIGMLASVAAHYSSHLEDDGAFTVADSDSLLRRAIGFGDYHVPLRSPAWQEAVISVRALLEASRLGHELSGGAGARRYRFEPEWLMSTLAKRTERELYAVEAR